MKNNMKKIELLPKFYSNEEKQRKTSEMKKTVNELLDSDLLPMHVKEKVNEINCDMFLVGDTYSRNYEIKKLNSLIDYFNRQLNDIRRIKWYENV